MLSYRWVPVPRAELSHLATEGERDLARRHVYARLVHTTRFHVVSIAFILLETVACVGAVWLLGPRATTSVAGFVSVALAGAIIGVAMMAASFFVLRRFAARLLREHLSSVGVPVCLGCGYRLTGLAGVACPECGVRVPG